MTNKIYFVCVGFMVYKKVRNIVDVKREGQESFPNISTLFLVNRFKKNECSFCCLTSMYLFNFNIPK